MYPKVVLDQDYFGIYPVVQGLVQYEKMYGPNTKPSKIILTKKQYEELSNTTWSGPGAKEWEENIKNFRFVWEFKNYKALENYEILDIPVELSDDGFQLI